jgi:hypothetical protein
MTPITFQTTVGSDRTIRLPEGVDVPAGSVEVELRTPPVPKGARRHPGVCKGMISYMAPDFDAPLDDLKEYME